LFAIIIFIISIISIAIFVGINSNNNTLETSNQTVPVIIPVTDIQQNSGSPIAGTWKFENTQGIVSTIVFDTDDNAIIDGKPFKYSIVGSNLILRDNKSGSAVPYKLVDENNLLLKLRGSNYDNYMNVIKIPVVAPTSIVATEIKVQQSSVSSIEKAIVGWWNENKPKAEIQRQNLESSIVKFWNENTPKAEFTSATYEIETMVFHEVNEERKKRGLKILNSDSKIAEMARLHSLDMANRSYFSHVNPEGEDPTMRAKRHGIETETQRGSIIMVGIGENIGMMPTGNVEGNGYVSSSNDVADAMMKGWMNSPGHRANILESDYNVIGVGVAYNGYGTYYLTQDFK
jgi:uncharacterized protein YkwD